MKRRILSIITALALCLGMCPPVALAVGEVPVTYQEASWNGGVTYTTKTADSCTPVADSTTAVTWNAGWYVVNSSVTISEPITVTGAVNLILADGCTLDAQKGIVVETGNSLTIYAQSVGTGTLNATGTNSAGIGGAGRTDYGVDGGSSGAITIHGGNITATSQNGAGIGGGAPWAGANGGSGSNITIYGGSVTAQSTGTMGGAGIGGGGGSIDGGTGESINIYGGTVNATGGNKGAGIGGGSGSLSNTSGSGTNITISGGTVTAVGGNYAAGIGGGGGYYYSNNYGSGGCTGGTGSVTISGGIVDASSPTEVAYANYKGDPIGNGGNAGDTAATVSKTTGIVFENGAGTVCGDVTLDGSYTVPAAYTLNIPAGASLSGSGTLSGGSAFTTENLTEDMISVPTNLYYNGEDRTEYLTTELSGELTTGVTICGQTFTVSGWTLAVEKAADSDLTYTAIYTNNSDNTKTVQKTITLLQSGTKFEGGIKTYNGETETTSFTAGDTITVKATPTPTGDAPQKAAARLRADPTAGQMAVFVGDTQVSEPVGAGEDGSYTMTVSAADVLTLGGVEPNGDPITLTAKFVGNGNMADGAGTVTVSITAVAKAELDGKVIGYYDASGLDAALANSGNDGATFTLLANVEPNTCLTIQINCILNLGGHTITGYIGSSQCVCVDKNTAVTIRGEGEIISPDGIALAVDGNATLEGGTYTSTGSEDISHGVYVGPSATLSVTGEKVSIRNTSGGNGLVVVQAQSVRLSAGTYSGTTEAISSSVKLSDMLAHTDNIRYAYYQGDALVTTGLDGQALTGTVTVKACTHAYQYAHTPGTTTHSQTCPACGDAKASEKCDFSNGPCPCGAVLAVTLPADLALTYDGTAKTPAVTVTVDGTTTLTKDTDYSVAYENNVEAGEDTAKVTVTGKTFTGTATLNFSIGKATLTVKADDQTITYGGNIATGTNQVTSTGLASGDTLESVTLEASSDQVAVAGKTITPSGAKIQNSSGEDVTGNYEITYQPGALTINKAQAAVTGNPTANTLTYTGAAQALVTAGAASVGEVVYSLTETGIYSTTIPTGTDADSYTVWYKVEGTTNYEGTALASVDVTIAQATAPAPQTGTLNVQNGYAREYTYDLNRLLPVLTSGQSFGGDVTYTLKSVNITEAGYYDSDTAAISGTTLTLPVKTVESTTESSIGTITVTISSKNFADVDATINVNRVNKQPVSIEGVTAQNGTYDGESHNGYTGTPTASPYSGGFTVTYAKADGTALSGPPTNAGDYTVTITLNENNDYTGNRTLSFTISKASITIKADDKRADVGAAKPALTYTVTGLVSGDTLATAPTLTCTPDMNTVGSYPITASGAAVPNTSNYNENITYVEGTLTVTAKPSSGGSSGGSTTPSQPVTTGPSTGDGASSTQTTATPTATTQGGTSTASVSTSMGNEIVKQAVENKSETVVIAPQSTGSATKTEVSIPASTVGQIGSQTSASLTVSTSVADVTIPNGGLGSLASAGGTVTVTAEQSGDTVELTVTAGRKTVESIPGGVTLTVPATSTTPGTVAMLVREDGTREVVRKSVAGETSVTIPLDGSAKLVIADNSKHFDDVPASSWAADAVAFASAHELFNGTAPGQFSPGTSMSRGMLAVVLHNLESNPEQAVTGIFGDVDNDQWYAEGVAWAAENGIVSGYGNGQFGPNDAITREQLAAMLWRYAGKPQATSTTLSFADADKVSGYAKPALLWAAEKGIVNGKGGGILDPLGTATRAEVAQMLKNFLK